MNSLIEQIRVERPNEKTFLLKIFGALTIGTISICTGLSGTLNDGKGVPKLASLLLGSSLCGLSAYWAYEASKEKQIWDNILEVKREILQQAAAIEGEVSLEAHQAFTEERVLNALFSGNGAPQALARQTDTEKQAEQTANTPQAIAKTEDVIVTPVATAPVQPGETQEIEKMPQTDASGKYQWIADMRNTGNVLVCGAQGSGKTGKLQYLQRWHRSQGAVIWVFDSHASYGQYPELEDATPYLRVADDLFSKNLLFGGGMNFDQINEGMKLFVNGLKERYEKRYTHPDYDPFKETRIVLICEEMQNWSKNVSEKTLTDFVDVVLTSTRKANMCALISSQSEKVSQFLGKACRGNAELVETALAKAKGNAVANPSVPGGYTPSETALWKPSGTETWQEVSVPTWLQ